MPGGALVLSFSLVLRAICPSCRLAEGRDPPPVYLGIVGKLSQSCCHDPGTPERSLGLFSRAAVLSIWNGVYIVWVLGRETSWQEVGSRLE